MAKLTIGERRSLEELLDMGGGYVLDFSNRTFEAFVYDSVDAEIYDDRYRHGSGSKANRLRGFWKIEPEARVGQLIADLVAHASAMYGDEKAEEVATCRVIAERLRSQVLPSPAAPPSFTSSTVPTASNTSKENDGSQPVRAFISYSWDSDGHKDWVRELADVLATDGIDITLDQYDMVPRQDRFHFMEAAVRDSNVVLCVCTPSYVQRANGRSSGAGTETG